MYDTKNSDYYSNNRTELIHILPNGKQFENVLEIGCSEGNTLMYLKKNNIAKKISGIDIIDIPNSNQTNLDYFEVSNIEEKKLKFESESFDLILLGDVLEHLYDPWKSLEYIKTFSSKDGYIIISIPNARYFEVIKSLIIDADFAYKDEGVMDQTHIRFFCKKNMITLIEKSGLKIELISSSLKTTQKNKKRLLNTATFGIFEDFLTTQYFFRAINN